MNEIQKLINYNYMPQVDIDSLNNEDNNIPTETFKVLTQKEFDIKIKILTGKLNKSEQNNKILRKWNEGGKAKISELENEIKSLYQVVRSAEKRDRDAIRQEFAQELEREKEMKRQFLGWLNEV